MRVRQVSAGILCSLLAVLGIGASAACSDDATPAGPPGTVDGGGTADSPAPTATEAKQKGRIVDALNKFGVTGAIVTVAGKSATTDAEGNYEIVVPKNVPYSMSVTEAEHYKLNEQEWIVKKDLFDRTDTSLLETSIANVLLSFLPPRDATKGVLVVRVNPLPPCDTEQGSTISIEPAGTSKITYFANARPNQGATSATKDEAFSAAVSDVDIGVAIKVNVTSPLCEQLPFPIDYQDVTYTGVQKTEPGQVLSYIRVFIGPKKIVDAGTD